jgi:hypothetical protein
MGGESRAPRALVLSFFCKLEQGVLGWTCCLIYHPLKRLDFLNGNAVHHVPALSSHFMWLAVTRRECVYTPRFPPDRRC